MRSLRDLLALVLLLAATVLGALWLPATWVHENLVERDGFLAVTVPLGADPQFQRTLTDGAVEAILDDDSMPQWLQERVTPFAQEQAANLTDTEIYAQLWARTMDSLHDALFTPGSSPLEVDLDPAIAGILDPVQQHLPFEIPRPSDVTITLATIPDVPLLSTLAHLTPYADRAGIAALGLAVAALLIGAHRRVLLAVAGGLAVLAGIAVWQLAARIEAVVPDLVDRGAFLGPIVQEFERLFAEAMVPQAVIMMGAGALTTAAGLVLLGLHRR